MGFWNIVFSNPAVLAGGLALFVPYLVHLLTRRTPRRLVFPTVRFIRNAEASHSALFKLRDIILLLVRTAFVALLFLAFLKPVLHARATPNDKSPHSATVIILDRSLSMSYTGTGFTPFARGQLAAAKIVDHLGPEDVANVILAGAVPVPSFDAPAPNKYHLKRDIQQAKPSLERADLDAAVAEAVRQLSLERDRSPIIYFVSDFQRTNWAAVDFSTIPEEMETVFVPVNEEHPWNLAITEVVIEPPMPVASEDVEIVCSVANYGRALATAAVSLSLSETQEASGGDPSPGPASMERKVDVQPGQTASVSFRLRPLQSGPFEGTVRIEPDGLAADDGRFFTLRVTDRVDVIFLTDERLQGGGGAGRFLLHAIEPVRASAPGVAGPTPLGTLRATVMTSDTFDLAEMPDAQIVVIEGIEAFGETLATALSQYIHDGGAVLYFLSTPVDSVNLAALESITQKALPLPILLGSIVDYAGGERESHAVFAEANFDDPMLRRFRESGDLGTAHFYRLFSTERIGGQGQILIRYSDGNIALARTSYGAGSLLLCNFDLSRQGSDLARKTLFVPLLHELLKGMRPHAAAGRELLVGHAAVATATWSDLSSSIRFTNPAGEAVTANLERAGERVTIVFPETPDPGFYRVNDGDRDVAAAAVNVDSRESNLESLTLEQLQDLSRDARRQFAAVRAADASAVERYLEGLPLWPYLLLVALAILGLEQVLLLVMRR